MKGILSFAICVTAVAALAADGDVTIEVGSVDVTKVESGLTKTIIATSYLDMDGSSDVAISNIVDTADLAVGTQLAKFDGTNYDTWTLTQGSGNKYWKKNDVKYTVGSDGRLTEGSGASGSDTTMKICQGLWLLQESAAPVYLYGKPSATKSIEVSGKTLVGNPTQSAKAPTISGMGDGDQILIPASSGTLYGMKIYTYSFKKSSWVTTTGGIPGTASLPSIEPGQGFWYSGSATITWE